MLEGASGVARAVNAVRLHVELGEAARAWAGVFACAAVAVVDKKVCFALVGREATGPGASRIWMRALRRHAHRDGWHGLAARTSVFLRRCEARARRRRVFDRCSYEQNRLCTSARGGARDGCCEHSCDKQRTMDVRRHDPGAGQGAMPGSVAIACATEGSSRPLGNRARKPFARSRASTIRPVSTSSWICRLSHS